MPADTAAVDETVAEMTIYTPKPVESEADQEHYRRTLELHQRVSGGEDFIQQEGIQPLQHVQLLAVVYRQIEFRQDVFEDFFEAAVL